MRHIFVSLILLAACSAGSGFIPGGSPEDDAGTDAGACPRTRIACSICNAPADPVCSHGVWMCPSYGITCPEPEPGTCSGTPIACSMCGKPTNAQCTNGQWTCPAYGIPCASDAGTDASGPCGPDRVQVVPCCGGTPTPPDAAACVPPPPYCAPKPTGCTPGQFCSGGSCNGGLSADGLTLSCECA
jgi:hypothetical protein